MAVAVRRISQGLVEAHVDDRLSPPPAPPTREMSCPRPSASPRPPAGPYPFAIPTTSVTPWPPRDPAKVALPKPNTPPSEATSQ